jgi:hypothetical protein
MVVTIASGHWIHGKPHSAAIHVVSDRSTWRREESIRRRG